MVCLGLIFILKYYNIGWKFCILLEHSFGKACVLLFVQNRCFKFLATLVMWDLGPSKIVAFCTTYEGWLFIVLFWRHQTPFKEERSISLFINQCAPKCHIQTSSKHPQKIFFFFNSIWIVTSLWYILSWLVGWPYVCSPLISLYYSVNELVLLIMLMAFLFASQVQFEEADLRGKES